MNNIICEWESTEGPYKVERKPNKLYCIKLINAIKHDNCTSEDVMCALAHYLESINYKYIKEIKS